LRGKWVPPDTRDEVVDFVKGWSEKAEFPAGWFVRRVGVGSSKFYRWRGRYGMAHEHNGKVPRDHWLLDWEKQAIIRYHFDHPLEGYRRLAFMMIDEDVVCVSPASVYRVLSGADLLGRFSGKPSLKGAGFQQPGKAHEHWHIDVSHVNICGTFYYLFSVIDGYSRFIVDWDIRESMQEWEIEIILERAKEKYPEARPRIISDNGPQFIALDFREFIRISGMTHVRTSPYYPQSNGKKERWYQTLKKECIRPKTPLSLDDAKRIVGEFVDHYNNARLHSAIGYIAPADKLAGREEEIWAARDRKLEAAREERKLRREAAGVNADHGLDNQLAAAVV
jgi:putative transposase